MTNQSGCCDICSDELHIKCSYCLCHTKPTGEERTVIGDKSFKISLTPTENKAEVWEEQIRGSIYTAALNSANDNVVLETAESLIEYIKTLLSSHTNSLREGLRKKVEGMRKEMDAHPCPEGICYHFPRTDAHNRLIDALLQEIDK